MRKIIVMSLCCLALLLAACSQVREAADQVLTPVPVEMENEGDIPADIATAAAATIAAMSNEEPKSADVVVTEVAGIADPTAAPDDADSTLDAATPEATALTEPDAAPEMEIFTENDVNKISADVVPPVSAFTPDADYEFAEEVQVGAFIFRHWVTNYEISQGIVTIDGPGLEAFQVENATGITVYDVPDLTGNGLPNVSIERFTGGASCCFGNVVYEVTDTELVKILNLEPNKTGAQFEDINDDGIAEALTTDNIFAYRYCGGATSPYPLVVLSYDADTQAYTPASIDYPDAYIDSIAFGQAQASTVEPGDLGELDDTNKCPVLYYVLPLLYSGQTDLAWTAFDEYYEGDDAEAFRWEIEDSLQASKLYVGDYQSINPDYELGSALDPSVAYELTETLDYGRFVFEYFTYPDSDLPGGDYVRIMADGERFEVIDYVIGFNDLTDTDLTNDGTPEVVIERFTGGAHCCSGTEVYSVGERLENVLSRTPSECGGAFNDLDDDGTYEFITCDDVFAYAYCPYVGSPFPQVVMTFDPEIGYTPASPTFPDVYAETIVRNREAAEISDPGAYGEFDGSNKCSVLPVVLDHLYAGQQDLAWSEFERLYTADDAPNFREEIQRIVGNSLLYVAPPQDAVLPGEAADAIFAVVGVAADDVLNMRAGAGVEYDIVATIGPDGQAIRLLPTPLDPNAPDWVPVVYGTDEGWVNSAFLAEQRGFIDRTIDVKADAIIQAIRDRDISVIAAEAHPEKSLLVSADGFIDETDPQFSIDFIPGLLDDTTEYTWGLGFGEDGEINYTFSDYLTEIAYTADLAQPDLIGFRERVSSGNTIDNAAQVFPDGVVVEYYYAGTDEFGYLDWRSLRLIFEPIDNDWKLVAIVSDAWTP